jgi:hypothetical protein
MRWRQEWRNTDREVRASRHLVQAHTAPATVHIALVQAEVTPEVMELIFECGYLLLVGLAEAHAANGDGECGVLGWIGAPVKLSADTKTLIEGLLVGTELAARGSGAHRLCECCNLFCEDRREGTQLRDPW